ncbi:hypothetical protein [Ruminococcus albus]|uniref:Uncharacterized protein n=1 Tax=Ruminococcus albus 8 TaxID=246199 RepID=E9S8X2_RUMAL|nr:hypothetical protein [Ruminococcus albus]EGC04249.1 hypothetical protein CUS_5617 [Ruminococcus albus 8]MCC3349693.1 hypothetical protein [Ruminococcus albus 8]
MLKDYDISKYINKEIHDPKAEIILKTKDKLNEYRKETIKTDPNSDFKDKLYRICCTIISKYK